MLSVKVTYVLELTPQEFRLISAALREELKPEWKAEATELQDRLFHQRNNGAKAAMSGILNNDPESKRGNRAERLKQEIEKGQ
jgi:hypothetical protein